MHVKDRLIDLAVFLSLLLSVPATSLLLHGTVVKTPLKVALGVGQFHTNRISAEITVDGQPYDRGIAFRSFRHGHEVILVYFETPDGRPWEYEILNIIPDKKLVGFSLNAYENGALLIGDGLLLQDDVTVPFVPLQMTIKSGMINPEFRAVDKSAFEFVLRSECERARSVGPRKALSDSQDIICPRQRWHQFPKGKWRVRVIPD